MTIALKRIFEVILSLLRKFYPYFFILSIGYIDYSKVQNIIFFNYLHFFDQRYPLCGVYNKKATKLKSQNGYNQSRKDKAIFVPTFYALASPHD